MIVLPAMPAEQTASWLGLLDLFERLDSGWTLIGSQLVHLHCAERGQFPVRPTNDADTVVDVRSNAWCKTHHQRLRVASWRTSSLLFAVGRVATALPR
jgi:hypothetical protein